MNIKHSIIGLLIVCSLNQVMLCYQPEEVAAIFFTQQQHRENNPIIRQADEINGELEEDDDFDIFKRKHMFELPAELMDKLVPEELIEILIEGPDPAGAAAMYFNIAIYSGIFFALFL